MKKSFLANIIEKIIRILNLKKKYSNKEHFDKYIKKIVTTNYKLPTLIFKSTIEEKEYLSNKVYFINKKSNNHYLIVYLHGGGYLNHPLISHLKFVDKLAHDLNTEIIFPLYPLLPKYSYKEVYELLDNLYNDILKEKKKIIFMGDSAGGGLALAFNEYLYANEKKIPDKLVLISPWVDVSITNKSVIEYENLDPTLSTYGLKKLGKLWAKDIDLKDYRVSPTYGNLKSVKECLILVGTNEMLYPDIHLLYKKMINQKVKSKLVIGKNMNHVYVLYPIKEAKESYKKIIDFIKK